MMELIVEGVGKAYGNVRALAGVSFRAGPGVLALLGPNGSGKSTLMRLLATALRPDAGRIQAFGRDYAADPRPLRRILGYLPQDLDLPPHMTPRAFLRYVAHLKAVPAEPQASRLLGELGLEPVARQALGTLSGGQARLVGIAQALLGRPRLLVLDEPLAGLDLEERARVFRLLRGLGDRIVTLSSHVPAEIEGFASRVVVLRRGSVIADGTVDDLRRQAAGAIHEVRVPAADLERVLRAHHVTAVSRDGDQAVLRVAGAGPAVDGAPVEPTLEEAYLLLQGAHGGAGQVQPWSDAGRAR